MAQQIEEWSHQFSHEILNVGILLALCGLIFIDTSQVTLKQVDWQPAALAIVIVALCFALPKLLFRFIWTLIRVFQSTQS